MVAETVINGFRYFSIEDVFYGFKPCPFLVVAKDVQEVKKNLESVADNEQ